MQESILDSLETLRPRKIYTKTQAQRIALLERNLKELENYCPRCPKNKQFVIRRLIEKYGDLLTRLEKTHFPLSVN